MRDDIHSTDIGVMQLAVCAVADVTRESAPDAWRRTLSILLDGLQPARDSVHPMTAPALTPDQFDAAMHSSGSGRR